MTGPRYPSFGAADLERALAEARPLLAGARVKRVRERGAHGLAIEVRRPDPAEATTLYISLDPRLSRLHLAEMEAPAPSPRTGFGDLLRARLEGDRFAGLEQVPGERVARLSFERGHTLVLELFGPRPNAHLLGEGSLHPAPLRELGPPRAPRPSLFPEIEPDPATRAYSRALEAAFAEAEALLAREAERAALSTEIARRRRKLEGARRKLEEAIAAAAGAEEVRRVGDALLASLHLVRPGAAEVTVPDYYRDAAPLRVELDPKLRPPAQAERYFKRAKKLKRGGEVARERLAAVAKEAARLDEAAALLTADDPDFQAARALAGMRAPAARPRKGPQAPAGPHRFRSRDGLEIVVGRTDAENDRITRDARGNDLFLHVQGFPGSHVIVRADPGKPVPLETMLDAAALAMHYSKARDFAKAEVSHTPRKYVRKPRGAKPGLVVLERHETLFVARDEARLRRLLETEAERREEG